MKTPRNNLLSNVYSPINNSLENVKDEISDLSKSYNNEKHLPFLSQLLEYSLNSSGKKLRPTLSLLSAGFGNQNLKTVEKLAAAVELLHIATLVHDDTVDDSNFRRGKATISNLWGDNSAVLIGDYIFAASATQVCATGNIRVIRRFSETIMELSLGELQEMEINFDWETNLSNYLERIYNKTASLFSTSAQSGAILSGCDEESIKSLQSYGYNIGMAFQIVDDILDFQGKEDEVGKPTGSDLSNGILTLPSIYALESDSNSRFVSMFDQKNSSPLLISEFAKFVASSKSLERALSTDTKNTKEA